MGFSERQIHASSTGAALCLRHEAAAGEARGIVHILHGLADHSERYGELARLLAEAGYHAYAHDQRGHGFTEAPGAPQGVFDSGGRGAELVIEDIVSVQDRIVGEHPGLPLFLFGHSMGGTFALAHSYRHAERLAGVAAWNASLIADFFSDRGGKLLLAWERFRLGSDVPSFLMPRLTFGLWAMSVKDRRTEFDWLSRDPAAVDAYLADPLCGWPASVGMWRDIMTLVSEAADPSSASAQARRLPYHLLGGGRDPATKFGRTIVAQEKRMRAAGFEDVAVEIVPEMRHETLNEIGREPVIAGLTKWLNVKAQR